MAENTIDNLSIQVTASAENAARVFDRLASSAGQLRGAASVAAGGMRDMAQGARDAGTATQQAGEQSGRAAERVRTSAARLSRAMYDADSAGRFAQTKSSLDVLNMKYDAAREHLAGLLNAETPNNRAIANATAEVQRLQTELENAGKSAEKGSKGIVFFWNQLKRVALYRVIRSVIREITDAFKTGITNLYQWSAAVNGTFAKSMDRIATSTLYLKNSLGAMLAPLINTLAPVIEWIIDRIVDVINWINKLFSALSGSQTYTVAKKVATTWADAGKSAAGSAKKAADDIKRTILGFDEINKLEKQNTSSYGGGSGSASSGPNYNDMFEERRLDGWMSKLASFIDKFNLQIPAVFGALLAGWAAVKLAIEGVAKLSLGWLKDMAGKAIDIAVSLFRKGWTTIKNWALSFGEAVVDMAVRIKTSVAELWAKLAAAWAALSPVLKVGIAVSVTAAALWGLYKLAWALVPDKMLQVEVAIKTAAVTLKNGLVKAWNNLAVWSLSVGARIATTAAQLKNDIIRAWNKLTEWFLGVKLRIETKLADLWKWIKDNWKTVAAAALGIAIAIATPWSTIATALSSLWADVMASFGGALAFSVVPTLNPTGDYGLGWTPSEFNSKQEEIGNTVNELRGSSTVPSVSKDATSTLVKWLLGAGGAAAAVGFISSLLSGGASTALASVFMPGINSAADKSPLSPKTSYYDNMTGELVVPKSVDVGVNYVANGNKSYKNSTLGKYLTDTMAKVKSEATTKVKSVAGTLTKIVSGKLVPITGDTETTNTVNGAAGSFMTRAMNKFTAVVGNTDTINTVSGRAGLGMKLAGMAYQNIVGDTSTTNTVKGAAGAGMVYTWNGYEPVTKDTLTTNTVKAAPGAGIVYTWDGFKPVIKDTTTTNTVNTAAGTNMGIWGWLGALLPKVSDTTTTNTVNAKAGTNMNSSWYNGLSPKVNDTNASATVGAKAGSNMNSSWYSGLTPKVNDTSSTAWVDVSAPWLSRRRTLASWIGMDDLKSTAWVDVNTPWWYWGRSLLSWLGMDNLSTTVTVNAVAGSGGGGTTSRAATRANGGIYSNGAWSDIPQYASGRYGVNHGSLFWAGENGAEIVGNAGGRTEVLNKSQIASAIYSAVQAAMAPAAANFASAAESMGAAETGFDLETLAEMVRQGVEQAMSRSNDLDRQRNEYLRQINDKDFTAEVTSDSINNAQRRMNRRAGTTVVAVG